MLDQLLMMLDMMLEADFNDTPNFRAMSAIRDALYEKGYDPHFVDNIVANIDISLNAATPDEATLLGEKFGKVIVKFVKFMRDNGFDNKSIVTMVAKQMNLHYE